MTDEECKNGMEGAATRLMADASIEAVVFVVKFADETIGVVKSKVGAAVPANLLSQMLERVLESADGQVVPADGKEPS